MSVQVSYKKQLTFFLILFVLFLIVVEISVRIYEYVDDMCDDWNDESQVFANTDSEISKQICLDLYSKSEKYDTIRLNLPNQHFPTLNINSEGFRGPEILREKPDNVYRIFVVGGSTIFGDGATSDETTIPGFLQKFFDKNNFDLHVEVINAGIESAYSTTENYYIKNTILFFQPDLIISYGGLNDAGDTSMRENIQSSETSFDVRQILIYRTPFFLWGQLGLYPDANDLFSKIDSKWISERTDVWKNHWLDICELGEEKKFKTIIMVQPMLGSGDKNLSSYESSVQSNLHVKINVMNNTLNEFAMSLNELDEKCYATEDLRNVFDRIDEPVYYDLAHVSDFGNKIVAEKIYEKILPLVMKDIQK